MEKVTAYKYNGRIFESKEEVENYKIGRVLGKMTEYLDIYALISKLTNLRGYRQEFKEALTPKAEKIRKDNWTECSNCGGSVGISGNYCKNCGAKFVEVQDE